jgi:hypothetical protein
MPPHYTYAQHGPRPALDPPQDFVELENSPQALRSPPSPVLLVDGVVSSVGWSVPGGHSPAYPSRPAHPLGKNGASAPDINVRAQTTPNASLHDASALIPQPPSQPTSMMPYDSSFDAMDHDFERLEEFDDLNLDMKSQAPTEGHDEFRKFDFDSNQYHQRGPSDRPNLPPLDHRAYSYSPPSSQPQLATSANPFDEMSWDTTSITFAAHESRQNSEVSKPSERYNNFQATQKSNTPAPINSGTS